MRKNKNAFSWIFLSVLIVMLDQFSKYFILTHFTTSTVIRLFPFLNFILSFNDGAAFSFLGDASGWQVYLLSAISITISVILIVWLCRIKREQWTLALPISLILGGAIGNLIDRIRFHFVIDFIDFHVKTWHYATFNIADSAVCVGALWLMCRLLWQSKYKN